MKSKTSVWVAWGLVAVVIGCTSIGMILSINQQAQPHNIFDIANSVLNGAFAIAAGIVGALILAYQPRNTVGGLLMLMGVSLSVTGVTQALWDQTLNTSSSLNWVGYFFLWFANWSWWLLIGPLWMILLVFPTGRLLSARWRWVLRLIIFLFITFLILIALQPAWNSPDTKKSYPNPLAIPVRIPFDTIMIPWEISLLASIGLCVASVFIRYRRSGLVERQQLKWFFFACAVFLLVYSGGVFDSISSNINVLWGIIFDLVILFIPVSIGIAILRYRLFDIDVIIRRTIIYSTLTAVLALLYFGFVVILQQILRGFTGQASDLAIIASTLAIAALFNPLRRRVQFIIDRRFYRGKYDASQALAAFAASARDNVELEQLAGDLVRTIEGSMQPEQTSLWLKKSINRRNFELHKP